MIIGIGIFTWVLFVVLILLFFAGASTDDC